MPMSPLPTAERLVAAQRALLETSHRLGLAALDGSARLYRLQFQATQHLIAGGRPGLFPAGDVAGSGAPTTSTWPGDAPTATDGTTAKQAAAGAVGALLLKEMAEIVTTTGAEVARIMAEHGTALRSTLIPAAGQAAAAESGTVHTDMAASEQAVASKIASTGAAMPVAPLPTSGTASAVAGAFGAPTSDAGQH